MKSPNFLILDELTNDLDIFTLQVLEDYLISFQGCLIVVSHDRYFMNKIVDHLFVMNGDGIVSEVNGNYTKYRVFKKEQAVIKREEVVVEKKEKAERKEREKKKLSSN